MKTIFDEQVRKELIDRISSLHENSARQWGKMTVYQMTKHCTIWDEWVLGVGDQTYKQSFPGMIFGKLALKSEVWADKPMKKGMPAGKLLTVKETGGDVELQKKKWIQRVNDYASFSNTRFVHDFFGRMTKEEIGIFAFKHADHHLRQFNA
jgi:hypothetical protein